MITGTIKIWNDEKGYGFIQRDSDGLTFFFTRRADRVGLEA